MEVNGFDRTQAYLSHYTSGAWDVSPSLAAVSAGGSLYSMTRTGITSLSPFHVSGTTTTNVASDISVNNRIILSPNPTTGILNFITSEEVKNIEIYTTIGTVVKRSEISNNSVSVTELPAGLYFVRFMDKNINTVQRFVKQ